ncbi:MAG TPA: alpha/beta fold hydrolase [Chitinophagaceae bacterium]|jgi:pimeloyl-ACP methyl ester carboxylesterase|nr:alpha/beta fold hydrolase [Chitinophagaceae bacterium]
MTIKQRLALMYLRTKFSLLSSLSKRKAAASAFNLFRTPQTRNTKLPSRIFDKAEKLQFDIEGATVHGYSWNHNVLKKVLIVHGFESSIVNFDHFVFPLMDKGYGVLAFDAPGHGRSGGTTITAPLFAKMITMICEKYGPVQSFMAHSFGGLTLSMALENMDHNESFKVVFIAPLTELKTSAEFFFQLIKVDEKVRQRFDELITEMGGHPLEWYSIRRAIKNIKAHVLWVHDEDDDQTPVRDALKVKKDDPANVKFLITKGLGHSRIYTDKKMVQEIIDFL